MNGGPDADADADADIDAGADEEPEADGGVRSHTIRLELVDEPGELLNALRPIAENGGNLLSIFHERGSLTPRGHIPVEVDLECPPDRFEVIIEALREAGVNVIEADTERYTEGLSVVLVGHLIDTDLSDTLSRLEDCADASVVDVSLSAPDGTAEVSSARIRLAATRGNIEEALAAVRDVAAEKDLRVVEPLVVDR
jgi:ACT domain-containing protein